MATTSSATVSSSPIIDAIVQVNEIGMINITRQLIDANPNISNPFLNWQDFGTFTPNSTVGLKPGNLIKRALQRRTYTTSSINSNIGVGASRYNLGAYYVTDIYFSITSNYAVDALLIKNDDYTVCSSLSSSYMCNYYASCSCKTAYSCTRTCSGLNPSDSYSILFLRYNYPTATISGSYGYSNIANSTDYSGYYSGFASALVYGGVTYYIVTIVVPIVIFGIIIGACCWSSARNRRQQGVIAVQQPFPMMQQSTAPVYFQNPGYNYPVTQQGYTGLPPSHEQQGHYKQNQPYQEPRRNIDRTKPLDQSDYQ